MAGTKGLFGYDAEASLGGDRLKIKRGLQRHEHWADAILPSGGEAGKLESETNRRPLWWLGTGAMVIMAVLSLRLFQLQITGGQRNLGLAEGNRIHQKITRAPRGVIYDRNHQALVRNEAQFDLTVIPALLPRKAADRQALYRQAAQMAGVSAADIASKAEAKGLAQVQPQLVASGMDREHGLLIDQSSADLPGFSLDVNPIRNYPSGSMLANILGYAGRLNDAEAKDNPTYLSTDYIGKTGVEKSYEDVLRGVSGSEQTEVDANGRPVKVLAEKPAAPGQDLVLSIDSGLQQRLTQAVQAQLDRSGSKRGSAVAMDPRNGEVLAMVSLPSYDNNLFSHGISGPDYAKLSSDPGQPLFNKPVSGAYPSGSTIKPFIASAGLQEHVITPDTVIVDSGKLEVPNVYHPDVTYTYYGWEHSGLGSMTVVRAIAMSSDIFFYEVGGGFKQFVGLGVERLTSYYNKFGLGSRTGIDVPDETAGRVPTPEWKQKALKEPWYTGDTYNISVGQGDILISPLQLATALSAVANGGTLYKPHVAKQVLDAHGQLVRDISSEVVRKSFISPANLATVREGMRQAVVSGTACCIIEKQVPVHVAAKTGTAETDPGSGRKPDAWFEAFAPYEDPRIVVTALVENAPGEGAEYAAPIVRETLDWYFRNGR